MRIKILVLGVVMRQRQCQSRESAGKLLLLYYCFIATITFIIIATTIHFAIITRGLLSGYGSVKDYAENLS